MIMKVHKNVPEVEQKRNAQVFDDKMSGMSSAELIAKYKFSSTRLYFIFNRERARRVLVDIASGVSREQVMAKYEITEEDLEGILNPKPVEKKGKSKK